MIQISYDAMILAISLCWLLIRCCVCIRQKRFCWQRELQLMLVYICLIVVARFTFFPFSKVDGRIQPLVFDTARIIPFRINFLPIVYMFDYDIRREALINFIGNTAMFIPIGIVWPSVFPQIRSFGKAMAAGIGFSLCIEILQLPFFDRVSDIDDLILNSLGYFLGYSIWVLVIRLTQRKK